MKAIVLAAGEGVRLRPYTQDRPKCMVPFKKKAIIDYILDVMGACNLKDIVVINGYKKQILEEQLSGHQIQLYTNEKYGSTNMVTTLFCAGKELNDDVIISYSDIIYSSTVLELLLASSSDFSVVVDKNWWELWELRMDEPLADAETMKLDNEGNIIELGKKPKSYDEIEGQYIGLIKISRKVINKVCQYYDSLDRAAVYDGKSFDNMYMTSFIQLIIDNLMPVKAVMIEGGWLEIDTVSDLERYDEAGLYDKFTV